MTERLLEKARYHFDAVLCESLDEAVKQAKANSRRGLLVCGSEAIALEAAKLLLGGRTYDQIVKEVEISTATISRINRCIQYGTGGYQSVIEKISAQEKKQ